jgi:phage recombination protein Bet
MLQKAPRPGGLRPQQLALLQKTVAAECTAAEFDLFVETAEHYGLDPFRRQIMPLIIGRQQPERRRLVIIVGIEGQRIIAQRCGNYRPASEPTRISASPRLKSVTNPAGIRAAQVKLWQQDNRGDWFPVVGEAHWEEFAPLKEEWQEDPQTQARQPSGRFMLDAKWTRMPRLMLAKCATMQALRAGWPEAFGGLYAEEEMDRARVLDLAASQIVERERQAAALRRLAGKDAITIAWDGWDLENVPLRDFATRVRAWMDVAGRQPAEIAAWAAANTEALRQFWAAAPNEALTLKQALEAGSRAAVPSAAALSSAAASEGPP